MKPALLVIDLQNEFFEEGSPALGSLRSAVEYVNATIALFRRIGAPIAVVRDIEEPRRVLGSALFEVHSSVDLGENPSGDIYVNKRFGNAFWKTDLEVELRSRGVDFVVLTGFCAEYCVLSTLRGAQERGFGAALLQHGTASPRQDHIDFVERICDVISYRALAAVIGG